jgi:hypothetical protein
LTDPYLRLGETYGSQNMLHKEQDAFWHSYEDEHQRRQSTYQTSPPIYSHSPLVAYPYPAVYPASMYPHAPPYVPIPMYMPPPLYPSPPSGYPAHPYPTYSASPGYAPPYYYDPPPHYLYLEHGRDSSEVGTSSRPPVGGSVLKVHRARYSLRSDSGL